MNHTHIQILFSALLYLFLPTTLSAQSTYWDEDFRRTQDKESAHYYSTEIKEKKTLTRTYYDISTNHKRREETFRKKNLLHQKTFGPNETLFLYKGFNPKSGTTVYMLHDEHGNPILKKEGWEIIAFFSDGSRRPLLETKHKGEFIHYYDSGEKMMQKTYEEGREVGETTFWYKSGKMRSLVSADGRIRNWGSNGELSFISDSLFENGDRYRLDWDEEGNLTEKIQLRNGKYEGKHTEYYPNGQPIFIGQNHEEKRSGIWKFFKDNGDPLLSIDFDTLPDSLKSYSNKTSIFNIAREQPGMDTSYAVGPFDLSDPFDMDEEPFPLNIEFIKRFIGYPRDALDYGIQGQVVMRVLVDEEGKAVKYKVMKMVHPLLYNGVEKFVMYLRFSPAIKAGKAIPFWVNIPFNFKLLN